MDAQAATGGRDDSRRRGGSSDPQLGLHREYFGSASVTNFTALILKGLSLSTAEVYNDDDHHDDENASALQKEEARISRQRRTLPHPTQAEAMLQVFFANTHQLYPFIHEATYKRDYVKLYESLSLIYPEQLLYGGEPVIDLTGAELTEDQELHLSLIEAVFAMVENTALGGFLEGTLTQATRSMRGRCECETRSQWTSAVVDLKLIFSCTPCSKAASRIPNLARVLAKGAMPLSAGAITAHDGPSAGLSSLLARWR